MLKKILSPIVLAGILFFMLLIFVLQFMYGSCQTSKSHYIFQCYWMPEYFPDLMLKGNIIYDDEIEVYDGYTGVWRRWHSNGKRNYVGKFFDGEAEGVHEEWYSNGKVATVSCWKKGKAEGRFDVWHQNGNRSAIFNWVDGKLNGKQEKWFYNGIKEYAGYSLKGKDIGKHESWYQNGKKRFVYNFVNGKKHGRQFDWRSNENILDLNIWENGKKITTGSYKDYYDAEDQVVVRRYFKKK